MASAEDDPPSSNCGGPRERNNPGRVGCTGKRIARTTFPPSSHKNGTTAPQPRTTTVQATAAQSTNRHSCTRSSASPSSTGTSSRDVRRRAELNTAGVERAGEFAGIELVETRDELWAAFFTAR